MNGRDGLVPTKITDKNGKQTTVYRKDDHAADANAAKLGSISPCVTVRPDGVRESWKAGEEAWFEYHCLESDESVDAPVWHRSHQRVTVLDMNEGDGEDMTREERDENGFPFTYKVRFEDGLEWDVFEDELSDSKDGWFRPDPPPESS